MWVMNGIFPGGMKEGMSPTSATAIFGWANFLISSQGTAVNTMLATILGCLAAPLMNLIPYPLAFSYNNMKNNAVAASSHTAKLFESIIVYYCGSESSVVVESEVKHAMDLRGELDGLGGAIGASFWEGFDVGTRGTVRALMDSHAGLMNNIYDRLRAILIIARAEDFGPSHTTVMAKIRDASMKVALATTALLNAVTQAATDGDISSEEKADLEKLVGETKAAVKGLAKDFDTARKALNKPISEDLLGENYFVLTVSAYARLVIDYSEMMMSNPPKGAGFGSALAGGLSSTWDMAAMTDRFNINFTMVHFLALIICWFWSVFVDNWGGGCVITAVFLMSPAVCPDVQVFLNVLNAVIVAVVAGTLVFQWTCGSGFGDYILPWAALVLWAVGLYGVFAKSVFLLPCLVFVALTPFRCVTSCPTGEISAGARGLWAGMVANIIAIVFVCGCQCFLGVDRPSNLAVNSMDEAFDGLRKAFNAFWKHSDATEPMAPVAGALGSGSGYSGSSMIEPRMWRNQWKAALYTRTVAHLQTIRLDILMLWFAMAGSDGKPDAIFSKFENEAGFKSVQEDLNSTLEDAHMLTIATLKHEGGKFTGLTSLKNTTGIDSLGALPELIDHLGSSLKFPAAAPDSMEDDELCQISTVCMLLDSTIKHIAALIQDSIKQ